MKKIALLLIVSIILCSYFPLTAGASSYTYNSSNHPDSHLTNDEASVLQEKLIAYGYGLEQFTCDILYSLDDMPSFMIGISKNGYVILERNTYRFCECGEGNPYRDYMDSTKYYGGAACYFIKPEEQTTNANSETMYYDILRNSYRSFSPSPGSSQDLIEPIQNVSGPTSVTMTARLSNCNDYIKRKAFGYNDDDTCSAVATGIALNYIASQYNMSILKDNHVSESLNDQLPDDEHPIYKLYPNANRLHRYLVDTCRMGAASYADSIVQPLNAYIQDVAPYYYGYHFFLHFTLFPKASTIKANILDNKPVLITTTLSAQYPFHTMCVYGYRETSDGPQLLVHVGWYSRGNFELLSGTSDYYRHKEIWINESEATYGYYFSFTNPLADFTDIPKFNTWSYPGILFVVNSGIMNGTSATKFSPDRAMSRAMLVTSLYRLSGSPAVSYTNSFSDVPASAWYADGVAWASKNGIVTGVGGGKFNPNGNVTREQIATFLFRYAEYLGYNTSKRADLSRFPDSGSVSNFAKDAMSWAVATGILNGTTTNDITILAPKSPATRAQAASFLLRFGKVVLPSLPY